MNRDRVRVVSLFIGIGDAVATHFNFATIGTTAVARGTIAVIALFAFVKLGIAASAERAHPGLASTNCASERAHRVFAEILTR